MDVTCKYWPYLQRVAKSCPELQHLLNMRPFLSVFHAKAHDFKCEVKWSGAYEDGAGLTLGEEVEQCNAFLSRIAVTTKAGRTDMLTLMAMRWNQQKFRNLAISLTRQYQKTRKALQSQLRNLESLKAQFAVTESQLEDWVSDVKEWADDSPCGLSEEGLKGLQSIILRKQQVREMKVQARDCYLQVLSGEGNINFLYSASADEYDSDCEMSDDGL
ncbi:uncharacterized protein LOC122136760 [Cyprinus carpio]|uniref:Uncharacterized protein LOC122136760 n=1 Tax=Cyprinus carpio TaxID=7962 RepID=A0A9Q9W5L9_CYPCA|nr:uncharacterized protein LOC122136760 [Cyprinus carpio]XP_042577262.1 uncharacterized protein LOC122136760 [Cyprinus carpio]XP_042577263.1 uncharacterized protein LOC122136760 [Cyprinus carpio]XP_042577264.1 uncharacterized protein LOC122136760 [Cyprinus carpio]XP_042577266.1 uncharacterized protein LOC122136760 [Cyprinus carpio]XP_042577267.1 uncharacterized protein LOC122136760 [Cyprinus carpio]XP_042577268.1 uncharacterized protein LOC122136760 [Cyprinus carpio]XP_042577269.1 uncharacte